VLRQATVEQVFGRRQQLDARWKTKDLRSQFQLEQEIRREARMILAGAIESMSRTSAKRKPFAQ